MAETAFKRADILVPEGVEMEKWSVVACDQYTSEPEYWRAVKEYVGGAPSALHITLPEIYLGAQGEAEAVEQINAKMREYLENGVFAQYGDCFVFVERTLSSGEVRRGLVGKIDLEQYDFSAGSESPVRATEGTVLSRIPPRVRVRCGAALELPHIMMLTDDREAALDTYLCSVRPKLRKIYDFELMQGGGHIKGHLVQGAEADMAERIVAGFFDKAGFEKKYGVRGKGVLAIAAGDGNHSLATARECYLRLKNEIGAAALSHPARYALCELCNLQDDSLKFEPIHRVVFGVDPNDFFKKMGGFYDVADGAEGQSFTVITGKEERIVAIKNGRSNLAVGSLQIFIDEYIKKYGGECDYIHGDEVVRSLCEKSDRNIGFLLPVMQKDELFKTVILDGALPRKTFSMGHACDKRFYLEARRIK